MNQTIACIATCCLLASQAWGPAMAAESYDNCTGFIDSLPATIASQGTWCLRKDLSTGMTLGDAILVNANNVTIDCNHFKLGGLAGGEGTVSRGIHAIARSNVTVRHCNVRGFQTGMHLNGGGGHVVEDNTFDGNTVFGLEVEGSGSTVRRNRIIDTGGSTSFTAYAVGIRAAAGVDILDNTIDGVAPIGANASAYGLRTSNNGAASIAGNRIRQLAANGTGDPVGMRHQESGRLVIQDNHVLGPGPAIEGGIGIECSDNLATARGNLVSGFATGIAQCLSSSNTINTN